MYGRAEMLDDGKFYYPVTTERTPGFSTPPFFDATRTIGEPVSVLAHWKRTKPNGEVGIKGRISRYWLTMVLLI